MFMISLLDLLALIVVRGLIATLNVLPYRVSLSIAYLVVRFILFFIPRAKKVALRNIELVFPSKTENERRKVYTNSLWMLADNVVGFAKIPKLNAQNVGEIFDFSQAGPVLERVREKAGETGIMLATGHFGNFELAVQAHALLFRPAAIVARPFELPRFYSWWLRRRQLFGNVVVDRKGAYRQVEARLRSGEDAGILCDQNIKKNHAVFVDFFGIKAATTKTIALAALRTGAPVALTLSVKVAPFKYRFIVTEIEMEQARAASVEEGTLLIMEQMHRALENAIKEHPDHWFWIHRRFKTRPAGEPETMYS